jgi:hypothetical protein
VADNPRADLHEPLPRHETIVVSLTADKARSLSVGNARG